MHSTQAAIASFADRTSHHWCGSASIPRAPPNHAPIMAARPALSPPADAVEFIAAAKSLLWRRAQLTVMDQISRLFPKQNDNVPRLAHQTPAPRQLGQIHRGC